jgi:hypothetical protein
MSYNFIDNGGKITPSSLCLYDSTIGFESDFSRNGDVDGWTYYDGIHTYGCWNSFLFATLYGSFGVIGRESVFIPVAAEDYRVVRIAMKLKLEERLGNHPEPTKGKIYWRTVSNPVWGEEKSKEFTIYPDNKWHTYSLNMGEDQYWQGDINDLRVYPIYADGKSGDEFFIRAINIISVETYRCNNTVCSYYTQYEHNCPGAGSPASITSDRLDFIISAGSEFRLVEQVRYTITEGENDVLLLNINGYGYEQVLLDPIVNVSGDRLARHLAKFISKVNIGGYAEVDIDYTDYGEFVIYTGTKTDDSSVSVGHNILSEYFKVP